MKEIKINVEGQEKVIIILFWLKRIAYQWISHVNDLERGMMGKDQIKFLWKQNNNIDY